MVNVSAPPPQSPEIIGLTGVKLYSTSTWYWSTVGLLHVTLADATVTCGQPYAWTLACTCVSVAVGLLAQ